ncbi:glutamyl-Q tRNA(Asp) synthetase [Bombiscardovia nodaiensis]|uniref:Glutamyl-Q tRNA(Asp) synthetase n=1 Tax=Bombiscardovia nodaiensis TaxID=2932181 RepID=A0ABM8BA06_9BIFI|nr:glutamyl-Q tRNA(Asp) synthetase [Bombiscardovia nodaiensis]
MHLGNAYAALAAWLGARSAGGQVRLRIEDIDTPRVVKDADRWIQDDLAWLGLDWDGSVVYQSQRQDLYRQAFSRLKAQQLPEAGGGDPNGKQKLIYPCFCSRADIRAASAPNEGDGFLVYPGTCRHLAPVRAEGRILAGDRHAWRIAVPSGGQPGSACRFQDQIYGPQSYDLPTEVGDVVVVRSDGIMAYQLAVSVDDLDMGITQVVRGRDLLRSTALQLWIRAHLAAGQAGLAGQGSAEENSAEQDLPESDAGLPAVQWAHLPLVDGGDGRRLSKRYGSLDLGTLRAQGVRPQQVLGLCAWLLGLQIRPEPAQLSQLLAVFDWGLIAAHRQDRVLKPSTLATMVEESQLSVKAG